MEKPALLFRRAFSYDRRVCEVLASHMNGKNALSVGCGNGNIESVIQEMNGIKIVGAEVTSYNESKIPIKLYDGKRLPFKDNEFDTTMFVYVLHHTNNIKGILAEAKRVTRGSILILDHTYTNTVSKAMLKLYDYCANVLFRMPIPFNFLRIREWTQLFRKLDLRVAESSVLSPFNVFFKISKRTTSP